MPHRESADFEDVPRIVVGIGSDYTSAFELAEHSHRRGQLLYAASGVVTVTTPDGAWVSPPERGVWIPGGTPHAVRTVGAVQFRCVLIEPEAVTGLGSACQVVGITPLLRQLLVESGEIPVEYDEDGRDGMVMQLLVAEVNTAQPIPIAVPFPRHPALAERCRAFLDRPKTSETIDGWAEALAMDRRRFTRLFRKETGMSFMAWRQQACLSAALPRLAAGEQVTSIALDMGYESTANFSTMFRRALGVPPSAYRA
jgi:AraC-like DNA-binding protein